MPSPLLTHASLRIHAEGPDNPGEATSFLLCDPAILPPTDLGSTDSYDLARLWAQAGRLHLACRMLADVDRLVRAGGDESVSNEDFETVGEQIALRWADWLEGWEDGDGLDLALQRVADGIRDAALRDIEQPEVL